jgi:hypothetical protein
MNVKLYDENLLNSQNSYTKDKFNLLKYKFRGSENIIQNYSASHQDLFVLSVLDGKIDGFYLDIGGGDPYINSNSYLLEKYYGWKGASFDLKSELINSWKEDRVNPYLVENAITFNYSEYFKNNNFPKQIDYLSLDIEPAYNTLNCLRNLPLNEYRFSVITYETDYYATRLNSSESLAKEIREESRRILLSHGYILISGNVSAISTECPYEDWYVDPNVIDKSIYEIFLQTNDDSKFYEDIVLKNNKKND